MPSVNQHSVWRPSRVAELIAEACSSLYQLKQRSALALLGVMIGVASVVALLTIGHMAEEEALKIFRASGIDMLAIQTGFANPATGTMIAMNPAALLSLPQRWPDIVAVAPLSTGPLVAQAGNHDVSTMATAATPALQALAGLTTQKGRYLTALDADSLAAVIGPDLAERLSMPGSPVGVGSRLRLNQYVFEVVGVLAQRQASAFDPTDFNAGVIVPAASASRVLDSPGINAAVVKLRAGADQRDLSLKLITFLQSVTPNTTVQVQSAREMVATLKSQKAIQARLLAAIAAVSLLVGGIGVMNVMLMSVLERRREIGLRAAIGATPQDIQLLFLTEAVVLTLIGGISGAVLGVVVAYFAAVLSHWSFSLALYALPLGVGVSTIVGVVFGFYPARQASLLSPIEALHAE